MLRGANGVYRITRTVTLNSKGAASHHVDVELRAPAGYVDPKSGKRKEWVDMTDGGVSDAQDVINRLLGASYVSMRAIQFQFQRDPNPFINADPKERKAILAEILGLESLGRALKPLNEDRLTRMRTKDTAVAVSEEADKACDPQALADYRVNLAESEAALPERVAKVAGAKSVLEAAIAAAGAVGSERNTLQGMIDTLDGQAGAGDALRSAKATAEKAFQKTRDERVIGYKAAKARFQDKEALAKELPAAEAALHQA